MLYIAWSNTQGVVRHSSVVRHSVLAVCSNCRPSAAVVSYAARCSIDISAYAHKACICCCLHCFITQAVAAMRNVVTQLLTQAHSSTATLDSSSSTSTSKELYIHQLATEVLQGMAEESGGVLTATYIQVRCCTVLTSTLSLTNCSCASSI
jgi:hypothetical protein